MWFSRLFWKLFLSYAGLILLAAAAFFFIVSGWQENDVHTQVDMRLHDAAVLLRNDLGNMISEGFSENLQERVRELGQQANMRITLVNLDGQVLADSGQQSLADVRRMENHLGRSEIIDAIQYGSGEAERVSDTLEIAMRYFALRAEHNRQIVGVVRTSLPVAEIKARVQAVRRLIWLVVLLGTLSVLVLTYWVVARILRPIVLLTHTAEAISQGDYEQRLRLANRDEIGRLAEAFNRMTQDLSLRIAELRASGQRLATVLGSMVEGVIAVDARQRLLFANDAAGVMLGFSPRRGEGRTLMESVRSHRLHEAVATTLESGSCELELEMGDRGERILAVVGSPLPGDPCPGVVLVLHDISDVRRLESLRQEFVANVSHELKTPLSAIKAYAETLQNGAWDDRERRGYFVRQIDEQAERLHQLILDLLRLARIESGQQSFDITAVPVAEVVDRCLESHQPAADARRIQLIREPLQDSLYLRSDEEGLRQILDNLIDNAIKYTPEEGTVRVRWGTEQQRGFVEVVDSGIGIPPEHQPRLFERFYRVDKARSRELGGTGLGLSIVKHLTQSFGGRVDVASQPGRGSTFTIWLDVAQPESVELSR